VRVAARWCYLYRAIDQSGQVIDVFIAPRRDATALRRSLSGPAARPRSHPSGSPLSRSPPIGRRCTHRYWRSCWHLHGIAPSDTPTTGSRPTMAAAGSRLRPMRGLNQDRSARVIIGGHAFVHKLRRGQYELAAEEPAVGRRVRRAGHGDLNPGRGRAFTRPRPAQCNSAPSDLTRQRRRGPRHTVLHQHTRTAAQRMPNWLGVQGWCLGAVN
jgi:DDE domain